MADESTEYSPSGTPILRHSARTKPFEAAQDTPDIEKIHDHIEQHIGKIETVFHELVSDLVHVDVFFVKPIPERNFTTLITAGMSYRPMHTPREVRAFQYAELMLCLPPEWPLSDEALKNENYYWPIRLLKMLARLPHEYSTWLGYGHTVPNGDPARPYARNTKLSGAILTPPFSAPEGFYSLRIHEQKTIHFYGVLPIYSEEMNFKLKKGSDAFFDLLDKNGIDDKLKVDRRSVCKNSLWPF